MNWPTSLPGLDIQQAMLRISGKADLYLKLLGIFHANHGNDITRIKELIAQEKWQEATMVIHTLKGVSGNIGATEIYHLCQSLSQKIKTRDHDLESELEVLDAKFVEILKSVEQLLKPKDNT